MPIFLTVIAFSIGLFAASQSTLAEGPTVHEVTIATPNIVRIEVREPRVRHGEIVKLQKVVPSDEKLVTLPDGRRGIVIGPKRDYLRVSDSFQLERLNRAEADRAAGYSSTNGRRVTAVYRKSVPWSSGFVIPPGAKRGSPVVSFSHFIYLKFDKSLAPGTYTITWPANILPNVRFTVDDRVNRASSIHATQLGHKPRDTEKFAYLSLWLPAGPDHGAIDFRRYNLRRFEVINKTGKAVFTGNIQLRAKPQDIEPGDGLPGKLVTYRRTDGTTYQANRAGTYVFGLDYGGWRDPVPGTYRLRIPGLGVSDPFEIAEDIWHRAAQASMAGLYHQRSGLALDGRFGYTRPECFTSANGVTVYQSRLPRSFTLGPDSIKFSAGAKKPWLTAEALPDAWGGYHDAGDWDRNQTHIRASYMLLDLYEMLPTAAKTMAFNTPASGKVLSDPLYRDKDFPDLIDEAVWNIDFFRRLQRPDGGVPGGIESGGGPKHWEPSWLESQTVFAFAPDVESSYTYAAGAAKLAVVIKQLNETKLAELFTNSALAAWAWAERTASNPKGALRVPLGLLGEENIKLKNRLTASPEKASDHRLWAAAALYRLTGEDRFGRVVVARFKKGVDIQSIRADAGWEYRNAQWPSRSQAVIWKTERGIKKLAWDRILKPQAKNAYKNLKHFHSPMGWGAGTIPNSTEVSAMIRAYILTGEKKYLGGMQNAAAHILGANQIGMSFTTKLGRRWPHAPLHVDSIAAGIPAPLGITIYGWAPFAKANYWWIFGPKWAPLSDSVPTRRVEPYRASMPVYEYLIDYPGVIISAEYTIAQTIAPTAVLWAFLDGHDRGEQK